MAIDPEDDGVMSRWSKRKRGIAVEAEQEPELSIEEQKEVNDAYEMELEENKQAAEEIDLDTIDEESDLSVFMKAGVPEGLKKQALAMLWRSNPVFANIDGLNDYDDDFGSSDLIMKTFKSAYQAGRGYLEKEVEPEEELLAEAEDEGESDDAVEEDQLAEEVAQEDEATPEEGDVEMAQNDAPEDVELEAVAEVATPKVSLRQRLMQES